jgi:hypothetical protein
VTSANLLLVILIGTVVGAVVGLGLGGIISNPLWLGIVSGFLATITAAVVRDLLVRRGLLGPKGATLPGLYAAIASIAGSAGAVEIDQASGFSSPAWIGALAGLFSAILMALLMITYHMVPGEKWIKDE